MKDGLNFRLKEVDLLLAIVKETNSIKQHFLHNNQRFLFSEFQVVSCAEMC